MLYNGLSTKSYNVLSLHALRWILPILWVIFVLDDTGVARINVSRSTILSPSLAIAYVAKTMWLLVAV